MLRENLHLYPSIYVALTIHLEANHLSYLKRIVLNFQKHMINQKYKILFSMYSTCWVGIFKDAFSHVIIFMDSKCKLKATCTFLFLDSSSTIPVGKGKVEEE
ncbi:hypothetical protein BpHYR1_038613 [Brachionus plicatilis]|uniref:Uncharacterized protein n=1 Tax=Brachionus plicatilis TaxID=10195 RepID=A0A3M7QMJ3_BRAPC|nr:hypothetical protein BpHYR1_038613 [Brachionus plicatilis]